MAATRSRTLCPGPVSDTSPGVRLVRKRDTGCGCGVGAVGGTGGVESPQAATPDNVAMMNPRRSARTGTSGMQGDLQRSTAAGGSRPLRSPARSPVRADAVVQGPR